MEFQLTEDDARVLRHLASVDPLEARRHLQDRPELTRRMTSWPPEIRIEVCRILYRSFDEDTRRAHQDRHRSSDVVRQLGLDGPGA